MSVEGGVQVKPSPLGGKGTFATKSYSAGDVIFALDRPLVTALDKERIQDTCAWCFAWTELPILTGSGVNQASKVNWCTGCKRVKYCSKRCQSQAWKAIHKRECKELAKQEELIPNTVLAAIQVMDGLSVGDKKYNAVLDLEAHRDDFEKGGGRKWDAIQLMIHAAMKIMREKSVNVHPESAVMCMCVLMCNSSRLVTPTFDSLGLVLDPQVARINHSCEPNAVVVFDGPKLEVRALNDIDASNEVFISYVDSNAPFGIRQAELKDQYFFTCSCPKCKLGTKAPQDVFLEPGSGFEEGIKVIDEMMPDVVKDPAWPRHSLGDSMHEKRLSALQFYAYSFLESPDAETAVQDPAKLRKAIRILQNTGTWPLTRAPLPALYQQYAVACLNAKRYNEALIAMLRLHVLIDPKIYPQPHHPVRIVHSWSLATLAKAVGSDPNSDFCKALYSQGVDLSMLFLALLFEIAENIDKAFGLNSRFGQMVGGALQAMMEPGGDLDTQYAQMGIQRKEWAKLVEDQIKELWPKVIAFVEDDKIAAEIDQAVAV